MSEWKARRFWKHATVTPVASGWQVALDDRPLRTPGKHVLELPTEALARAIAAEWDAVEDLIDPTAMPLTRAANSTIEKVAPQAAAVAAMLAGYAETDLLCYRDDRQERLAREQAELWNPLLDWAARALGARLSITAGVVPVTQDRMALATLKALVDALDPWALTALHDLVTLPGSLVLGLAVLHGRIDAAEAHALSRLDEEFQARMWGRDDEAEAAAAARATAMADAQRFWHLIGPSADEPDTRLRFRT